MNTDETTAILRIRRDLTGESFNDGTIDAWTEALANWPLQLVRTAIVAAAREHQRVTVAHVHERLPRRTTPEPTAPEHCELCDGTGWIELTHPSAHNPRTCRPDADNPCACRAVRPCRCSTGLQRTDVHRRIVEHNTRTNPHPHPPRHELEQTELQW